MELALFVYLAGILTQLKIVLGVLVGATVFYGVVYSILWDDNKTCYKDTTPYNKRWIGIGVALVISLAIIPSERVAYTMAGAYAVQKIVEQPSTEEVSRKVLDIINMKLDNYLQEKQ